MSEYQYYEFLAVDKPLTPRQIANVRQYSSRAEITATQFTNHYEWGSFRGNVEDFLARFYDLHVYVANWGTHTFALALPARHIDAAAFKPYFTKDGPAKLTHRDDRIILTFRSDSEDGDWESGEEWMPQLAPLREEVRAGDLRPLYLGWLAGIDDPNWAFDEDVSEPPVPPGLRELTAAQKALVEFLRISQDLLAIAASASPLLKETALDARAWVRALPAAEKDALLLAVLEGRHAEVAGDLRARLRKSAGPSALATTGRTVGELRHAADTAAAERQRRKAEAAARRRAKNEAEAAIARAKYLDTLVGQQHQLWTKVEQLIATRLPKNYDQAIETLTDLRDLAARQNATPNFQAALAALRQHHRAKSTLIARVDKAGLSA